MAKHRHMTSRDNQWLMTICHSLDDCHVCKSCSQLHWYHQQVYLESQGISKQQQQQQQCRVSPITVLQTKSVIQAHLSNILYCSYRTVITIITINSVQNI